MRERPRVDRLRRTVFVQPLAPGKPHHARPVSAGKGRRTTGGGGSPANSRRTRQSWTTHSALGGGLGLSQVRHGRPHLRSTCTECPSQRTDCQRDHRDDRSLLATEDHEARACPSPTEVKVDVPGDEDGDDETKGEDEEVAPGAMPGQVPTARSGPASHPARGTLTGSGCPRRPSGTRPCGWAAPAAAHPASSGSPVGS